MFDQTAFFAAAHAVSSPYPKPMTMNNESLVAMVAATADYTKPMTKITLNELAQLCHKANIKWWQNIETGELIERNRDELLALAISEVSECLEGERKNLMDDKLPNRRMAEVEMADCYIRLLDFSAGFGFDLQEINIHGPIPQNKGEALFELTAAIVNIAYNDYIWISRAIAFIKAYCVKHGYDLDGAFAEKMSFNATREDHSHEARRIAGGKQF